MITDLRNRVARAIHRYDYERGLSGNDIPSEHHRGEAEAVIAALQDAYVPPPPGSDRDKLPDHLLAVIEMGPYLSTGCETAHALERVILVHTDLSAELAEWAVREHASCRKTRKQDVANCACDCHQPAAT